MSSTPNIDAVLFSADESALPALEAILESLPVDALGDVFVSVADEAEAREVAAPAGVSVTWVDRSSGATLADAVRTWCARSR